MTLNITTVHAMINGLAEAVSILIYSMWHFYIAMLSVGLLSVVMLIVILQSEILLSGILLSGILLSGDFLVALL